MCGFIAQLVEHCTGVAELTGSNPITAMIILHFDLQPQFKYMNYFSYTSHHFTPDLAPNVWLHSMNYFSYTSHHFTPDLAPNVWLHSMNYFSYTSHHFTPDLAPNVWLHSSVGRALHRCRRADGFKSHYCDDHSSL